jgi:glycosyltransferase 2 family protein
VPAALLGALFFFVDVRGVAAALLALTPGVVVLALVLATLDRLAMAWKWRQLVLAGGGRLGLWEAVRIHYQSAVSGRIVPAPLGADLFRAWLAGRAGVPHGLVLGSIAVERVVGMLVAGVLSLVGFVYLAGRLPDGGRGGALLAVVVAGLAAGSAALLLLFLAPAHRLGGRFLRKIGRWKSLPAGVRKLPERLSDSLLAVRDRPGALLVHAGLALLEHLLQFAKIFVLGIGVGVAVPPVTFVAICAVALFIRRFAGIVENWGMGEGAAVLAFALLGIDPALAVAFMAANFAMTTVVILPGALFYIRRDERPGAVADAGLEQAHRSR